jgi:hypothetical protein
MKLQLLNNFITYLNNLFNNFSTKLSTDNLITEINDTYTGSDDHYWDEVEQYKWEER